MDILTSVFREIEAAIAVVDKGAVTNFTKILQAQQGRLFVVGEGRSGLMAKAFAMRLMHLGANVYVIGETITPAMASGDTIIAISGSGTTQSIVDKCTRAKALGSHVMCVTTNPDSPLGKVCSTVLPIPAATKYRHSGEQASIQPLSSLFDQATHIVLDAICLELAQQRSQTNESTMGRHSNLE